MMASKLLVLAALIQLSSCNFLIGTGSNKVYHVQDQNGQYSVLGALMTGPVPSYIVLTSDKRVLIATNEGSGGLQSFQLVYHGSELSLNKVSEVSSTGAAPCYLQLTNDNRFVGVANYMTNFGIFGVGGDGSLSQNPVQFFSKRDGHGPRADRQEGYNKTLNFRSHPHQIYMHPNQQYIYVSDLGLDRLYFYRITNGVLTAGRETILPPGTGPRHLIAHPSVSTVVYGANELSRNIHRYEMNQDGSLTLREAYPFHPTIPTTNADTGAAIVVSKAGYLYFSVRGKDVISVFKVNNDTTLSFIQTVGCQGRTPRFITLNPDETKLFVLHQDSDTLAVFGIDKDSLNFQTLIRDIQSPQSLAFL